MKLSTRSDFLFFVSHPAETESMLSLKEYFENMYFAN